MDFAEGLATKLVRSAIPPVPRNPPHRFFADDFRAFLGLNANDYPIGAVNLIIRQHSILQHEPPRPPPFAVIHPLVQNPWNAIPDDVVYLDVYRLLPSRGRPSHNLCGCDGCRGRCRGGPLAEAAVVGAGMAEAVAMIAIRVEFRGADVRVGSGAEGGHVEVRGVIGERGDAAEGMHMELYGKSWGMLKLGSGRGADVAAENGGGYGCGWD